MVVGKMPKSKKTPAKPQLPETKDTLKDMNSQAREEFLRLVTADTTLNRIWKDSLKPIISESIPDDLTPLQDLVDGGPHAKTQTTQN